MGTVIATINYVQPFEKTSNKMLIRQAGWARQEFDTRKTQVYDVRGREDQFTLDTHGFQYINDDSPLCDSVFDNQASVEAAYNNHAREVVQKTLGASKVYIFGSTIRRTTWAQQIANNAHLPDDSLEGDKSGHLHFAHIDYANGHAIGFVDAVVRSREARAKAGNMNKGDELPNAAALAEIKKHRWAMINYWQPIRHNVTRDALAVCDARSVPPEDMFLDLPESIEKKKFSTVYLKAPEKENTHQWHYLSDMRPDEVLIIKCTDTKTDGRARLCPHTAFVGENDHGPTRESIEVRTLVCWDDQDL